MRDMFNRNRIPASVFLCVFIACACSAAEIAPVDPRFAELGPLAGKLDPRLIPAVQAVLDGKMNGAAMTAGIRSGLARSMASSPVNALPLTLDVPHLSATVLDAIQGTGATVVSSSEKWSSVSIHATLEQIAALTDVPGVRNIALARRPIRRQAGTVNNQADVSMKADQARAATGLSGTGQKIGVISDSINQTSIGPGVVSGTAPNATLTGLTDQVSADLPTTIQIVDLGPADVTKGTTPEPGSSPQDEGAAMMELIHDIAPNAALAFASGGTSQATCAQNILNLAKAGCTITLDDYGFPNEPFFQDGPISQAIRTNYNAGIPHFTAVGNDGDAGVLGKYSAINPAAPPDSNPTRPSGNFFSNWGIGGATPGFLPISVPDGSDLTIILQWNQPFQSMGLGSGSAVDMDEFLYDGTDVTKSNLLGSSTNPQFNLGVASGDPVEIIDTYSNHSGLTQTVYLAINLAAGSGVNLVYRVVVQVQGNSKVTFPQGGAGAMTAFGHTTLNEAIAVGAIFYGDIDSGGKWAGFAGDEDPNAINAEGFSSKGGIGASGVPFYFDTAGKTLTGAPQLRNAPAIAAPDGVNTLFFGADISVVIGGTTYDLDSFPNFFGTSASAANAAAVAALLRERAPLSTPDQTKLALQSTALDIVAMAPPSGVGPDDRTGSGLINALSAANAVPAIATNPVSQTILAGNTITFSVTAVGAATLTYQWYKNGAAIPGATGATLTLTNVPITDDSSNYRCIVSNAVGTVGSTVVTLAVRLGPVITQQPANQTINLGATATFAVQAINGPLTYQWKLNGNPISGATGPSFTTAPVAITDDGAVYTCVITNQFGSVSSNPAKLTANTLPGIVSGPIATPSAAAVGKTVLFSASAIGSHGQAVTYSWDFGDGTNAAGPAVSHVYAAAQVYTVTLNVTDANAAVTSATLKEIIFIDANGDGLPDLDPLADNSSFVDALQGIEGLTPVPLVVKSLAFSLNFAKQGTDSLTLAGLLPVPVAFSSQGQSVIVVVGGVGRQFTLDKKGKGSAPPQGSFQLTFNAKAKVTQFGKVSFKIPKGNLQTIVAGSSNLTNGTFNKEARVVRATIFFNAGMYDVHQTQSYTAKLNKTGKTK